MLGKLSACLRQNAWLLLTGFLAFTASSYVGSLTVDANSTTPVVWLLTMWAMLAYGALIMVVVAIDCVQSMMNP